MPRYSFASALILSIFAVISPEGAATNTIANSHLKLEFIRETDGYGSARLFAREKSGWVDIGVWKPLFKIGDSSVRPLTAKSHTQSSIAFVQPPLYTNCVECEPNLRGTRDRCRQRARS